MPCGAAKALCLIHTACQTIENEHETHDAGCAWVSNVSLKNKRMTSEMKMVYVCEGCGKKTYIVNIRRNEMATRVRGVVKWFNGEKGYGFITPEEGADLFVHYSAIQSNGYRSLNEGDKVEFEITEGKKGKQASDVTIIK
jgi:cold shock protein